MNGVLLVSIIITNYNYGRYLRESIDSALDQTHRPMEVVAVDDGSNDNSRDRIAHFGSRVIAVLKKNEGQGSRFNAGLAASKRAFALLLDSDDVLLPTAVDVALRHFEEPGVVNVHWPFWVINQNSEKTGKIEEPVLP